MTERPCCQQCQCGLAVDFIADCVDEDLARLDQQPVCSQARIGALLDLEATIRVMVVPTLRGLCSCCHEVATAVRTVQRAREAG